MGRCDGEYIEYWAHMSDKYNIFSQDVKRKCLFVGDIGKLLAAQQFWLLILMYHQHNPPNIIHIYIIYDLDYNIRQLFLVLSRYDWFWIMFQIHAHIQIFSWEGFGSFLCVYVVAFDEETWYNNVS